MSNGAVFRSDDNMPPANDNSDYDDDSPHARKPHQIGPPDAVQPALLYLSNLLAHTNMSCVYYDFKAEVLVLWGRGRLRRGRRMLCQQRKRELRLHHVVFGSSLNNLAV